jgi:hypothetical protein
MPEHHNEYSEKSAALLRDFQKRLAENGIESQLRLFTEHSRDNRIHIDAVRIRTNLDVTVTEDYQLEIALTGQRYRAEPDAAVDLIFALVRKNDS